jgi:hypothetical protein
LRTVADRTLTPEEAYVLFPLSFLAGFVFSNPVQLRRRIFSLLFLIAGVLLIQSVRAQTLVFANPGNSPQDAPNSPIPFVQSAASPLTIQQSILLAVGGTINGTGPLTLKITDLGKAENKGLNAVGPNSLIDMEVGSTTIDMTEPVAVRQRGVFAEQGGEVIFKNATVELGPNSTNSYSRAIEASNFGSTLTATDTNIAITVHDDGAYVNDGGTLTLIGTRTGTSNTSTITLTDSGSPPRPPSLPGISDAYGLFAQYPGAQSNTTLTAMGIVIQVTGDNNSFVSSLGYVDTGVKTTTILENSYVTGSGTNNFGLDARWGGEIDVRNSTVTSMGNSDAGIVDGNGVLNISDSTIHGDRNGIVASDVSGHFWWDEPGTPYPFNPDMVTLTGSSLTNSGFGGNGAAAFRVMGAQVNIFVDSSTVDSGGVQHPLLNVSIANDLMGNEIPTNAKLFATNSSILNGDILVDAKSTATVSLESGSVLTGAINENTLTGATGINPTEQITHPIAPGLPPFTANLDIDSTSTWNMTASSTLDTLAVNAQAHINFSGPAPPIEFLCRRIANWKRRLGYSQGYA